MSNPGVAAGSTGKGALTGTAQPRTIWPGVGRGFAHEDLPKHLFTIAAMHARRALAAAVLELDQLDRATSIGTSVELLAKAALALISPTLIAADNNPKSLLLYSGIPATAVHDAKSKQGADCVQLLKQSHSINFNPNTDDIKVFSVRNLALHLGQTDETLFDEALNIMTRLNEEILRVIGNYDSTLDRTTFWSTKLLAQVDLRLNEQREARRLALEELKALARRDYERLQHMGYDAEAFEQLADRDPKIDAQDISSADDYEPDRQTCPVCGFYGWLGYDVISRGSPYTEVVDHHDAFQLVDMEIEAAEFRCGVCGLRLASDLLGLVGMDVSRQITVEATQEEIDALEAYQIERYLEDEREMAAQAGLDTNGR